jgi:hypothetical protein
MHVSKPQAAWPRACTRSPTLRSLGRHSFIGAHNETHRQAWAFRIILQIRELEGMHRRWARDVPPRAWCLGRLSFAPGATADVKNGATSSAKGRHARDGKKFARRPNGTRIRQCVRILASLRSLLDFASPYESHPVRVARFDKQTLTPPAHVTRVFYYANVVMQLALCALHTRRGPSRIITGDSVAKKAGTVKMSAARTARARLRNRAP